MDSQNDHSGPRVTAIMTPASEDKAGRLEELLVAHAAHVEESEPRTLQYEMQRVFDGTITKFVIWEAYADEAAQRMNNSSPRMAHLMEKLTSESLVADWGIAYEAKMVGGFTRREGQA